MLKGFFGGVSQAQDQTTPKASDQRNPFDFLSAVTPSRKPSSAGTATSPASSHLHSQSHSHSVPPGTRTPTLRPSHSYTGSSGASPGAHNGFGSAGSDGLITPGASTPVTPGGRAPPTTAISRTEPDFSFKTQPSALTRRQTSQSAPRGKLLVKLISARHLSPPSAASRPYVVVTFDQNEFVSREPIHEEGEEATGVAKPRPPPPAPAQVIRTLKEAEEDVKALAASGKLPRMSDEPSVDTGKEKDLLKAGGSSPLSKSPSALGRSLEEFQNGDKPPKPMLDAVNVDVPRVSDEAKTPTGAADEPQNGLLGGDASMAYNPTWKHEVFFDVMNEKSVLQVQIYDRSIEEEMFLGFVEIRPKLVNNHTVDQWFPLQARPGEDHEVTGEIRIQIRYEKFDIKRGLSVNDFDFLRMIGKGTFGRVFQVRKKDTKRIYAMKVLSKREIVAKKEVAHTIGERKILQRSSDSPFLLGLKFSFQTQTDLYLVMDYKSGGELFHHLQKEGRFTEDRARFYTAEIVLAFEHLHKFDIVYRDLKPENILLDATGHIVLCDFGLSKPDLPSDALTNTFCGTTEYLAPEVLLDDNGYSKIVDFWSLGVLLFEMCCGWSPFYAEDTQQMYKLICFGKVKFPRGVIGEDGKQFVKGLLNRNPKHRLGANRDAAELKEHAFFSSIDWDLLAARAIPPPFKPYVDSDESVANFDPEFTEANLFDEAPHDVEFDDSDPSADWLDRASELGKSQAKEGAAPMEIRKEGSRAARPPVQPLTNSVQENFRGFTFSGEGESMIHQAAGQLSRLSTDDDDDAAAAPGGAAAGTSRRSASSGSGGSGSNGHAGSGSGHGHHDPDDEWVDER
ncbi:hypothetical protein JCM5296_007275 [Sporobolomyces johnsonii]